METPVIDESALGQQLKAITVGCRLTTSTVSLRKSLTSPQREILADAFGAELQSVRGAREVVRRSHRLVKAITRELGNARTYWMDYTVAFERGVRLIRRDRIDKMNREMGEIQSQLDVAVDWLVAGWAEIVDDARERLGTLFDASDYAVTPTSVRVVLSYPAIEPDRRLLAIAPELYEAERAKIAAHFAVAAAEAEQTLIEEFLSLVSHLRAKLEDGDDGRKKLIHASTLSALADFGARFSELSMTGNKTISDTVNTLLPGISLKELRTSESYKSSVRQSLMTVEEQIQVLVAPRRRFELE